MRWRNPGGCTFPGPYLLTRGKFDTGGGICETQGCCLSGESVQTCLLCRSGGIGRRAWFRSTYSQGCGGSSPFFGTKSSCNKLLFKVLRSAQDFGCGLRPQDASSSSPIFGTKSSYLIAALFEEPCLALAEASSLLYVACPSKCASISSSVLPLVSGSRKTAVRK